MIIRNTQELGHFLKNQRKRDKLSQSDIAQQVGVKQSTVSAFENDPSLSKLDTLFRLLSANGLELSLHKKGDDASKDVWAEEW